MSIDAAARAQDVHLGVRVEVLTIAWMAIEAVVAIGAGVAARSVVLTAFGADSVIELLSGCVLLWRLRAEAGGADEERVEQVERRAGRAAAVLLSLLCAYVIITVTVGFVTRTRPEASWIGLAVSGAAVVIMPLLAMAKRRIAARINSSALRADAAQAITCAYMASAAIVRLALNSVFGWWWADYAAAVLFLYWLIGETREAFEAARGEDHDDD